MWKLETQDRGKSFTITHKERKDKNEALYWSEMKFADSRMKVFLGSSSDNEMTKQKWILTPQDDGESVIISCVDRKEDLFVGACTSGRYEREVYTCVGKNNAWEGAENEKRLWKIQ